MRHSKPELTANVYTDEKLLDVAGALNALPMLRLNEPFQTLTTSNSTGVNGPAAIALQITLPHGNSGQQLSTGDHMAPNVRTVSSNGIGAQTLVKVQEKGSWSSGDHEPINGPETIRTSDLVLIRDAL